jgi:hypothetical protein
LEELRTIIKILISFRVHLGLTVHLYYPQKIDGGIFQRFPQPTFYRMKNS